MTCTPLCASSFLLEKAPVWREIKNFVHALSILKVHLSPFNPIALRKAKIVYNFDLSECNMVKGIGISI